MRVVALAVLAIALLTATSGCAGEESTVAVPMLIGLKQQLASDFATEKGFEVQVEHGASNDVPSGFVYLQSARGGSLLADGATLTIWVSSG